MLSPNHSPCGRRGGGWEWELGDAMATRPWPTDCVNQQFVNVKRNETKRNGNGMDWYGKAGETTGHGTHKYISRAALGKELTRLIDQRPATFGIESTSIGATGCPSMGLLGRWVAGSGAIETVTRNRSNKSVPVHATINSWATRRPWRRLAPPPPPPPLALPLRVG